MPSVRNRVVARLFFALSLTSLTAFTAVSAYAQADQGTITGVVSDTTGAVVANAEVTLTAIDTGLVLHTKTDAGGVYTFSPIKIGNYKVSAGAQGFQTTTQENVHVDVQQRLTVNIQLKAGAVTQTVTVTTAPPLLQTQESSVGQTMSTQTLNDVPLNGRNWVYIAQLANGAVPPEGSRGGGNGDFNADGQRAEQNNYILDGVDNNSNVVDFVNGASYVVQPPPDALAEFKVQTSDYSAEFGHSAGAVVNASIKAGTNHIHGDAWEYFRNTVLDARDFNQTSVPPYHENQFGATLGFPIFKNKLFFFGDTQANRIVFSNTSTESVPTALMRQGNFTELLNPALTGDAQPVYLYVPNSGGSTLLNSCGQNILCPSQIDAQAQKILSLYPLPNANGNATYNNYVVNAPVRSNTFQWDVRMDYNLSQHDQMFARFSYYHEPAYYTPPLGTVLDGGGFGSSGTIINLGQNFMFSETHVFTNSLSNEFRFGYNWLHDGYLGTNYNNDTSASLGLGGIPYGASTPDNGGLPYTAITGLSNYGQPQFYPTNEHENVFQILDNVTKIKGNHSLKFGVSFQSVRFDTLQPPYPKGTFNFTGLYTAGPGDESFTGYGVADYLADQNNSSNLSNEFETIDSRWYDAGYAQDDWRISSRLTVNLGVRYDHYQFYKAVGGYQALYYFTGPKSLNFTTGLGSSSAVYQIPSQQRGFPLASSFTDILGEDNVALQYVNYPNLVHPQDTNFAPRVGWAYSFDPRTVVRGGYGIFYGGLESVGYSPNLGENYPFQFTDEFTAPTCSVGSCPSLNQSSNISLENGFGTALAAGLQNYLSQPSFHGSDPTMKTAYTESYNLSVERSFSQNMVATVSYVGNVSRHLIVFPDPNNPLALENSSNNIQNARPLPNVGGTSYMNYAGKSSFNSLQAKFERRLANGLSFLGTYTWGHSLDDAPTPLGSTGDSGYANTNLLPIEYDYSNSPWDTRQRVTFNGYYDEPWGSDRARRFSSGVLNEVAGGWSGDLEFLAQTGNPFSVGDNISNAAGGDEFFSVPIANAYRAGGSPNASNPGVSCAQKTKNKTNWYNPCSFANPVSGTLISPGPYNGSYSTPQPGYSYPAYVTNPADVRAFIGNKRNDVYGPGFERINLSVFKNFTTFEQQFLQFRADIFNLFNTPALGQPNVTNDNSNGGQITSPRSFQNFTPDARFFQFALKYQF